MTALPREITHDDPVWRARANFIIAARIEPGTTATTQDINREQLWARKLEANEYELCCIPFVAYDLALGDVVATDNDLVVASVVRASGRFVFRVWFPESREVASAIENQLVAMGVLREWSGPRLLAVDAANDEQAQLVADFLEARERVGLLTYETGR